MESSGAEFPNSWRPCAGAYFLGLSPFAERFPGLAQGVFQKGPGGCIYFGGKFAFGHVDLAPGRGVSRYRGLHRLDADRPERETDRKSQKGSREKETDRRLAEDWSTSF